MTHDEKTWLFSKAASVAELMPAMDALSFFNNLIEAFRETQELQRDVAKIDATRSIIVTEITRRYDLYEKVFDRIFDERKRVIDKHFELIDRGLASRDNQLVLKGLEGLSRVVSSSPFANVQELSRLLESSRKIEI